MLFAPLLALQGCEMLKGAPPPEPEVECDLSYAKLAGRTFVRQERTKDGRDWKEDLWARARFSQDGGKLKMRYNTRALFDMYDYTCGKGEGEMLCKSDTIDLKQWCQTLYANKGSCSAAEVAQLTGASIDAATAAVNEILPQIKALDADALANMKTAFSTPNNQLRGLFHVKINKEECRLTVRDTFQTMTNGTMSEVDNFVGSSRFVETDKDLVFAECKDHASLVALEKPDAEAKPGQTKVQWKVGETIPFKYAGDQLTRAEDGCTYKLDTYVVYEPQKKGETLLPAAGGALTWSFDASFSEPGHKAVHLLRYKGCGGKEPELVDVTCARVDIEE